MRCGGDAGARRQQHVGYHEHHLHNPSRFATLHHAPATQISKALVKWYHDCLRGDFSDLTLWRQQAAEVAAAKAKSVKVVVSGAESMACCGGAPRHML